MYEWKATNAIYLDDEVAGKGRQFKCRFLVPGLVKYDFGVCLLTKENADRFIQGFVGCPVIINHQDLTDKNAKEKSVGNIFSVWFDDKDGYYWCNGIITDKHAIELIDKGYSVSCQYTITDYSDNTTGALHNGNSYDKLIEDGKPEHLAIVNNPRYEGAIIAVNAILAQNEDQWITIKPNGEDAKGRHLLIKEGETVHEAMQRTYGIDGAKGQQKLFDTSGDRKTKEDYKREKEEKQKQYDKLEEQQKESKAKEAKEKEEKKNRAIQDYIDGKITPEELEKIAPNLGFFEWMDLAKKRNDATKTKDNKKEEIEGLGTVEEVYETKDGVKQYKISGQWYSEKIIKETQKLNKYKKYTVQDIRKKIQDKKIDELKDIYEKYTSRDKADIFPNLFERAAVGGNVPKDLWLEHNIKETIEQVETKETEEINKAKIEKLKEKKNKLEDKLYDIKLEESKKYNNLGWGYGMRSYSRLSKVSFSKSEKIEKQIKEIEQQLNELEKTVASNSFIKSFKDTLYTCLAEGITNRLGE